MFVSELSPTRLSVVGMSSSNSTGLGAAEDSREEEGDEETEDCELECLLIVEVGDLVTDAWLLLDFWAEISNLGMGNTGRRRSEMLSTCFDIIVRMMRP